jgi:hypothetical protein
MEIIVSDEETLQIPKPNEEELKELKSFMLKERQLGKENIEKNPTISTKHFEKAINRVEDFQKRKQDSYIIYINNEIFSEINDLRKLIYSDLSSSYFKQGQYLKAKDIDEFIIQRIDDKFEPSLKRLIKCAIILKDKELAEGYIEHINNQLENERIALFKNLMEKVEKLKWAEILQKQQFITTNFDLQKNKTNILKWLFGAFLFSSTFGVIYFIIKRRK